jgi:hypothetical protein
MNRIGLSALAATLVACLPISLSAQETIVWSDIDCAQSKLVIPAGLKCRQTNVVGTRGAPTSTGGGQVKYWNASGIVQKVKLYYNVTEIISSASYVQVGRLTDNLRLISSQAKAATTMSGPEKRGDADFLTFTNALGDDCVGIRKVGTVRSAGYRWVLYATRCTPAAQKASAADIDAFIAAAGFRQ